MSVQSEINRLNQAKNSLKTAIDGKGVAVPDSTKLDGYGALVEQIESIADVPVYNGETDPDTPGGGGDVDPPNDGKTRLYITVPANAMPDRPPPRNQVPLCFTQSVQNGVTIDWGDGTAVEVAESSPINRVVNTTHTYEHGGDYVISLDPIEGCVLSLGSGYYSRCVMGNTSDAGFVYCNMLQRVVFGSKNVIDIGNYAFRNCYSLEYVLIPDGVTSIGERAFDSCYSLQSLIIPDSVTDLKAFSFWCCYSLSSIIIPYSVTSINNYAFYKCNGIKEYHFLPTIPPTLKGSDAFQNISSDCVIYVPVGSAEAYKTATNWTTVADHIQEEPA